MTVPRNDTQIPEPSFSRFLFGDVRLSPLWAILRIYLGWHWLEAGWGKLHNPAWVGERAGTAVSVLSCKKNSTPRGLMCPGQMS